MGAGEEQREGGGRREGGGEVRHAVTSLRSRRRGGEMDERGDGREGGSPMYLISFIAPTPGPTLVPLLPPSSK